MAQIDAFAHDDGALALDHDRTGWFAPPRLLRLAARGPAIGRRLAVGHQDLTGRDLLLERLTTLEDLLAVALRQHRHDGVLFDDGVEDLAEFFDGDQHLRLPEHRIESSNGLTAVFRLAQRPIQPIPHRLVVEVVDGWD